MSGKQVVGGDVSMSGGKVRENEEEKVSDGEKGGVYIKLFCESGSGRILFEHWCKLFF